MTMQPTIGSQMSSESSGKPAAFITFTGTAGRR
jgi:hypothetical protein